MWTIAEYPFTKNIGESEMVVKIASDDESILIESVGFFILPNNCDKANPFRTSPRDELIGIMQDSVIYFCVKTRRVEDIQSVHDILKKMNDEYVKQRDEEDEKDETLRFLKDCITNIPILSGFHIQDERYVVGHMCYDSHKNIKTSFEELAKHNLIDENVFNKAYDEFATKIQKCLVKN